MKESSQSSRKRQKSPVGPFSDKTVENEKTMAFSEIWQFYFF